MNTDIIKAQAEALAKASGGAATTFGLKTKAEDNPTPDPQKDEGDPNQPDEDLEARVEKLEERCKALEDKLMEKEDEAAKAMAAAADAMAKATSVLNAAAARMADPSWAQAFSAGQPAGRVGALEAAATSPETDADKLKTFLSLPAGSAEAANYYKANAEAIARAANA